jgi:hypothetical protein
MMAKRLVLAVAACGLALPAHAAPDCKEVFVGRARVGSEVADKERQKLALEDAIANWRRQVRHAYGFDYRYWTAARNKLVRCTNGLGERRCAVQARPCKLPASGA